MAIKATFPCQHCNKPLKFEGEPVYCKCNAHIGHALVVVPVHGPNIKVEEDFTDAEGNSQGKDGALPLHEKGDGGSEEGG